MVVSRPAVVSDTDVAVRVICVLTDWLCSAAIVEVDPIEICECVGTLPFNRLCLGAESVGFYACRNPFDSVYNEDM